MTVLEVYERLCDEYTQVHVYKGGHLVAQYDGRNSIPEEYNDMHVCMYLRDYAGNTMDIYL